MACVELQSLEAVQDCGRKESPGRNLTALVPAGCSEFGGAVTVGWQFLGCDIVTVGWQFLGCFSGLAVPGLDLIVKIESDYEARE